MTTLSSSTSPVVRDGAIPVPKERAVVVWAMIGLVWLAVCAVALGKWFTSDALFGPVSVPGPDVMPHRSLVGLRAVEVISTGVLGLAIWFLAVRPFRASRRVSVDALLILGGLAAFVMDGWLNLYGFLFAFNANSVNLGVWTAYLPFRHADAPARYAEALLWGLPMYVYFCSALGAVGSRWLHRLRRRFPTLSFTSLLAILYVGFFAFDFVVENAIIRTSEAYSFVQTERGLTLWPGSQFQFPVYECVLVAFVAMAFTAARYSADVAADGLAFYERGTQHLPAWSRLPVRAVAAVGYCAVVLFVCYHLPFNWISIGGDSIADLPSYLLPS